MIKVLDVVRNRENIAHFSYFCEGYLYYIVEHEGDIYQFPVSTDPVEVGSAPFDKDIKAITLMRYIRKAIENEDFIKIR
jgi:hypothetical protein